jgi:hypothetical protein
VREFMEHFNFISIFQYIEDVNVSEVNQHFIFVFKILDTGLKDFEHATRRRVQLSSKFVP